MLNMGKFINMDSNVMLKMGINDRIKYGKKCHVQACIEILCSNKGINVQINICSFDKCKVCQNCNVNLNHEDSQLSGEGM